VQHPTNNTINYRKDNMTNTVGILEVTAAQLVDAANAVNVVGDGATNARNAADVFSSRVVRVTDHSMNDVGEVGDDVSKMALFVSKAYGYPWVLGGAILGSFGDAVDVITPV
jgi:hypothetical protein